MRALNVTSRLAVIATLLLSIVELVAATLIEKYSQGESLQAAVPQNAEYHDKSPQIRNAFVSYDYGYSYPPPPPPTTYGEPSSTATSTSITNNG
ncbi:uncharacterized protein CTRU02_207723 [Colletotrichum truncatum]|uniref:Uncharacterized protein n=1 Tax=Colletotrichum truncatum TaxID=5467 RepID=A0ACC3Z1M0_COLTU|nr:uncharacterized protein CTRU02_09170 [Colletotrichum truncatum]KAF6788849.1 hypothetical protein CTRU02_09170 [Colletotrichum truncatum]